MVPARHYHRGPHEKKNPALAVFQVSRTRRNFKTSRRSSARTRRPVRKDQAETETSGLERRATLPSASARHRCPCVGIATCSNRATATVPPSARRLRKRELPRAYAAAARDLSRGAIDRRLCEVRSSRERRLRDPRRPALLLQRSPERSAAFQDAQFVVHHLNAAAQV